MVSNHYNCVVCCIRNFRSWYSLVLKNEHVPFYIFDHMCPATLNNTCYVIDVAYMFAHILL